MRLHCTIIITLCGCTNKFPLHGLYWPYMKLIAPQASTYTVHFSNLLQPKRKKKTTTAQTADRQTDTTGSNGGKSHRDLGRFLAKLLFNENKNTNLTTGTD